MLTSSLFSFQAKLENAAQSVDSLRDCTPARMDARPTGMKPALVTGASGFLGWHVARVLLERGYTVTMKPALVTGASGFLGWHVARVLLERGYTVKALVRPGSRVNELEVETVTGRHAT